MCWLRLAAAAAALSAALFAANPAFADGGAHVIDGSGVETPGTCHLESWVTLSSGDGRLINSAPACTRKAWPNLELGGFVTHGWSPESHDTLLGLSPKIELRSATRGLGIGVATSAAYQVDRGHFHEASLIVPVTIPVDRHVTLNLNSGWQWSRAGHRADLFVGGQMMVALNPSLSLMAETFTRDRGKAGGQTGVRWTTGKGRIDIDLLVGRYVDGTTPTAVTFGVTLRR